MKQSTQSTAARVPYLASFVVASTLFLDNGVSVLGRPVEGGELPPDDYLEPPISPTPCGTEWVYRTTRYGVAQEFVFTTDRKDREDLDGDVLTNKYNGNPAISCLVLSAFTLQRRMGPAKTTRIDKTIVTKSTSFGFEVGGTIHSAVSGKISFQKAWSGSVETTETQEVDLGVDTKVWPCWQAVWSGFKEIHRASGYLPVGDEIEWRANCYGGTQVHIRFVERERFPGNGEKLVNKSGTVERTQIQECTYPQTCPE
ncbi:MAG: hypothetical protein K2Y21_16060 [Phycisphaerales bacterium]|nr:hypothetical protein [Phycisphaerales bacterium]